jgi:hypothetical protein
MQSFFNVAFEAKVAKGAEQLLPLLGEFLRGVKWSFFSLPHVSWGALFSARQIL